MNTHRKLIYFSTQNSKIREFSSDFRYVDYGRNLNQISEKSVKFRQNLVKFFFPFLPHIFLVIDCQWSFSKNRYENCKKTRLLLKTRARTTHAIWKMRKNHQTSWRTFAEILRSECSGANEWTHVNLIDLVKSFRTSIWLRNLTSIQPRTSTRSFVRFENESSKVCQMVVRELLSR